MLDRFRKIRDGLVGVAVLDAFPDTVVQVPFQNDLPNLCRALLAALIWKRTSSQGTSSSTILSIALIWPMILFKRLCRLSQSIHFRMTAPP
jgi:hypothetical protein